MKKINFKKTILGYCKKKSLSYKILNESSLCISNAEVLGHRSLTTMCDEWYSDHTNDCVVFIYNTGRIFEITAAERLSFRHLVKNIPNAVVLAKYGVKSIDNNVLTFITAEDAFAMTFILLDNELVHDEES